MNTWNTTYIFRKKDRFTSNLKEGGEKKKGGEVRVRGNGGINSLDNLLPVLSF